MLLRAESTKWEGVYDRVCTNCKTLISKYDRTKKLQINL